MYCCGYTVRLTEKLSKEANTLPDGYRVVTIQTSYDHRFPPNGGGYCNWLYPQIRSLIPNCGQTASVSGIVTIDSLKWSPMPSNCTIADTLRTPVSQNKGPYPQNLNGALRPKCYRRNGYINRLWTFINAVSNASIADPPFTTKQRYWPVP